MTESEKQKIISAIEARSERIIAETMSKTRFLIRDETANTGRTYIGEGDKNVGLPENAIKFNSEDEAVEYINNHEGWVAWATVESV